jgi:hypothetical protein
MVITLPKQLAVAVDEQAKRRGVSPENLAIEAIRDRYLPKVPPVVPQDEWERRLFSAAIDCGVSVPDEALSSEGLYD